MNRSYFDSGLTGDLSERGRKRSIAAQIFRALWSSLLRAGEKRASREVAFRVRSLGGQATGDLDRDVRRLAALYRFH